MSTGTDDFWLVHIGYLWTWVSSIITFKVVVIVLLLSILFIALSIWDEV